VSADGASTVTGDDNAEATMATLHIEHPISDLDVWLAAFQQFAEARRGAGVTAQRIYQPVEDDKYILVQLDFDSAEAAAAFKSFLETVVWASTENSPGLAGTPHARVLEPVTVA
jgi:hypothetical protein